MGQATLDLPDPLEPAAAPATPAAADDLLAQLAGDEIDRLLSEAEVEPDGSPAAPPPARSSALDVAFDAALNASAHSEAHKQPAAPGQENLPVVATSTVPAQARPLNRQTQQVFAGTSQTPAPTIIDASPAAKVVDAKVIDTLLAAAAPAMLPSADAQLTPVVVAPVDGGTSLAERDGLRAGEIEALTAEPLGDLEEPDVEAPVPLVLKPLVWINAPFNAIPEVVREALGKVAIVTLVNAIGVLAYVLIFRRH